MHSANPFSSYDLLPLHEKKKVLKKRKAQGGMTLGGEDPVFPSTARNAAGDYPWKRLGQIPPANPAPVDPVNLIEIQDEPMFSVEDQGRTEAPTRERKPFPTELLYTGLAAIDAFIPGDEIERPVVQPQTIYNEHPYGTGSQAIAKYGKKLSYQDGGDPPVKGMRNQGWNDYLNTVAANQPKPSYNFWSKWDGSKQLPITKDDTSSYNMYFESMMKNEPWVVNKKFRYDKYGVPNVGPTGGQADPLISFDDWSSYRAMQDAENQRYNAAAQALLPPVSKKPMKYGGKMQYAYGGDPTKPKKPKVELYTPETLEKDTKFARAFIERKEGPSFMASNATVGKVGDPRIQFEYANPALLETGVKQTTLPRGVSVDDVFQDQRGQYGYLHPQYDNFVVVDPTTIYSLYGKKKQPTAPTDLQMLTKMKWGGKMKKKKKKKLSYDNGGLLPYFVEGEQYDLTDQQVADLISQGYELDML